MNNDLFFIHVLNWWISVKTPQGDLANDLFHPRKVGLQNIYIKSKFQDFV